MQEACLGSECEKGDRERRWPTQLSKDVPEPVDDEHYAKKEERSGLTLAALWSKSVFGLKLVVGLFLSH
jgi:hypothetical protein